ncbi:MAG: hypothetical protein ACFFD3_12640 [Candidatus Thorarchaeota archaeon]
MSECAICGRHVVSKEGYCEYHSLALQNIHTAFESWNHALEIDWKMYLSRILDEESLGKFAREVVEHLMQQDGSSE